MNLFHLLTLTLFSCLTQCSITVKRNHNNSTSKKESIVFELDNRFRGLAHCYNGKKHGLI